MSYSELQDEIEDLTFKIKKIREIQETIIIPNLKRDPSNPPAIVIDEDLDELRDLNDWLDSDIFPKLEGRLGEAVTEQQRFMNKSGITFKTAMEPGRTLEEYFTKLKMIQGSDRSQLAPTLTDLKSALTMLTPVYNKMIEQESSDDYITMVRSNKAVQEFDDAYREVVGLFTQVINEIEESRNEDVFVKPKTLKSFVEKVTELKSKFSRFESLIQSSSLSPTTTSASTTDFISFNEKFAKQDNVHDFFRSQFYEGVHSKLKEYTETSLSVFAFPHRVNKEFGAPEKFVISNPQQTVESCAAYMFDTIKEYLPVKLQERIAAKQKRFTDSFQPKTEGDYYKVLINLYSIIFDEVLSEPIMLKLQSMSIQMIIDKFLPEASASDIISIQNILLMFTTTFYVNVAQLHNVIIAPKKYTDVISARERSSLHEKCDTQVNYSRRLQIDTTNFEKFIAKLKDEIGDGDEPTLNLPTNKKKLLYISTFLKVVQLLIAQNVGDMFLRSMAVYIIKLVENKIFEEVIMFIKVFMLEASEQFITSIDNSITMTTPPVITYVKIRVDPIDGALVTYNKRFKVLVSNKNKRNNTMFVSYNDDNFPYYDMDYNGIALDTKLEDRIKLLNKYDPDPEKKYIDYDKVKFNKHDIGSDIVTQYKNNYVIGPLTRVFHPGLTNGDISLNLSEILNLLQDGKTVLMLGYGASGAGKTSTLIYFNKGSEDNKDGILINLCNIMAEQHGYKRLKVTASEFYTNKEFKDVKHPKVRRLGETAEVSGYQTVTFVNKGTGFKLSGTYMHQNEFVDRIPVPGDSELKENGNNCAEKPGHKDCQTTKFVDGADLGAFLIHLIDNDRYVKATTNNPNSSRSHALICISFETDDDKNTMKPKLIIGDFAGVENTFDCGNLENLRRFVNIQIPTEKGIYFYDKYYADEGKVVVEEVKDDDDDFQFAEGGYQKRTKRGGATPEELAAEREKINQEKDKVKFIEGCRFEQDDMYTFDKEKFLKPLGNKKYDAYFTEDPKVYTSLEKAILDGYNINIDEITRKVQTAIDKAEAQYKDNKNSFVELKVNLKKMKDEVIDTFRPLVEARNFNYNPTLLEQLRTGAEKELIAKGKTPEEAKAEAMKVTSVDALAKNIYSLFELMNKVVNMKEPDSTKRAIRFMQDFFESNNRNFFSDWQRALPIYKTLARHKDMFDDFSRVSKKTKETYANLEGYLRFPYDYKTYFEELYNEIGNGYKKEQPSIIKELVVPTEKNDKLNRPGKWYEVEYSSPSGVVSKVTMKTTPLPPDHPEYKDPSKKEYYKAPTILINMPQETNKLFEWFQIPFHEKYIMPPGSSEKPDLGVDLGDADGGWRWIPQSDEFMEDMKKKIKEFYNKVLDPIFGAYDPNGGKKQATSKISMLEKEFNDFWDNIGKTSEEIQKEKSRRAGIPKEDLNVPLEPVTKIKLMYQDPDNLEYYYDEITKNSLFSKVGESFKSNAILTDITKIKPPEIKGPEDINSLMVELKKYSADLEKRLQSLPEPFDPKKFETWKEIVGLINDRIIKLLDSYLCKYPFAYDVCMLRMNEGLFINDSLAQTRRFISSLLDFKLESSLYPIPMFNNYCLLNDYCVTGTCFPSEKQFSRGDENEHVIIKELMTMADIQDPTDIYIGLFCVLNLSAKIANNPPPIPYIDINKLRKMITIIDTSNSSPTPDQLKALATEYDKLRFKINVEFTAPKTPESGVEDKTKMFRVGGPKFTLWNNFSKAMDDYLKSWSVSIDESDRKSKANREAYINRIYIKPKVNATNNGGQGTSIMSLVQQSNNLFKEIDRSNAASAIGTLEFMDQVSKFYNVKWICELPPKVTDITGATKADVVDAIDENWMSNFAVSATKKRGGKKLKANGKQLKKPGKKTKKNLH